MIYSSKIVSIVFVESCVVSWFLFWGNWDRASAALFSHPKYTHALCRSSTLVVVVMVKIYQINNS